MFKSLQSAYGLTLIELLLTMVIATIVLTTAVPAAVHFIRNNQLSARTNELVGSVHFARSEAIRRGVAIGICSSTQQLTCDGNNVWSSGWVIWVDLDNDGELDGNEEITYMVQSVDASLEITNISDINAFRYSPNGYLAIAPGGSIEFEICDDRTNESGLYLQINATGSPRVAKYACN